MSRDWNLEQLYKRMEKYLSDMNDICEGIEDLDELDKLGKCFSSIDSLEEVDIGDGSIPRPMFLNKNMKVDYKAKVIELLREYIDYFAWEYHEILEPN